jgi:hypothetical protein
MDKMERHIRSHAFRILMFIGTAFLNARALT